MIRIIDVQENIVKIMRVKLSVQETVKEIKKRNIMMIMKLVKLIVIIQRVIFMMNKVKYQMTKI